MPVSTRNVINSNSTFAVGKSDFKNVIEKGSRFIDKSLFIKEIIDDKSDVKLIVRPRRFGKAMNMSMLRYFFQNSEQDNKHLFHQLKIWQAGKKYQKEQGKYPLIFLTFKDITSKNYQVAYAGFKNLVSEVYKIYKKALFTGILSGDEDEQRLYNEIIQCKSNDESLKSSLKKLTIYLHKQYGTEVVVLIDEYDTPIHALYGQKDYADMLDFMRSLLGQALKDNPSLHQAVLTGILRVAKESIFSGLNNLRVYSVLNLQYAPHFGFIQSEIEELLSPSLGQLILPRIIDYYGGYEIGQHKLFNPWAIVNFIQDYEQTGQLAFNSYWIHTSGSELIKNLLKKSNTATQIELRRLILGEVVFKKINENTSFNEINDETIWSFLLLCGYLTVRKTDNQELLIIPNQEIRLFFKSQLGEYIQYSQAQNISHLSKLNDNNKDVAVGESFSIHNSQTDEINVLQEAVAALQKEIEQLEAQEKINTYKLNALQKEKEQREAKEKIDTYQLNAITSRLIRTVSLSSPRYSSQCSNGPVNPEEPAPSNSQSFQ